jgi:hypothetical protein
MISDRTVNDARDDTTMHQETSELANRTSRRRFLALVGMGGTLVAAATAGPFAFDLFGHDARLDLLGTTEATFRPHIGDKFSVGGQSVRTLTLADVRARGDRAFSLYFTGNEGLDQGTYSVRHATLGRFDLFVVPGSADAGMLNYEAAFNHGGI